jgi:hypothetical protein
MIGPNGSLYRSESGRRSCFKTFAADQSSSRRSLRSGGRRDFLQHHASALRIGRGTASGYAGQAQRDDALGIKPDLPSIGPKFPRGVHVASPKEFGARPE